MDLSGVGSRSLQQALRDALMDQGPMSIRERKGAWSGPAAWIHAGGPPAGAPVLLFSDLAAVAEAVTPAATFRWLSTSRSRRLWVVAFVDARRDSGHAARVEGILRALDGRLSLLAEPQFSLLSRRWPGASECVRNALSLLRAEALLDVRVLEEPTRLLVRFGDDAAAILTPDQMGLGAEAEDLLLHAAVPGAGGRTLQIPASTEGRPRGLSLEAPFLRGLVEEARSHGGAVPGAAGDILDPASTKPVGMRVRAARRAQGLSQRELGERIGMDQAVISNLERSVHSPRLDTLKRIARGLGLSLGELLAFAAVGASGAVGGEGSAPGARGPSARVSNASPPGLRPRPATKNSAPRKT